MPIWLRRFTFGKLKEYYDKQSQDSESSQNNVNKNLPKISKPNIKPSYTVKASTK